MEKSETKLSDVESQVDNATDASSEPSTQIDLKPIAKSLDLKPERVDSAVRLLNAGNTIPFITRYRKDETGGLGEKELREIKREVARRTALNERKSFVLKAIDNQGKLTDELKGQIERANQSRQIEDLYHPFKPRKTSLAETARQQGLGPLARDILEGHQPDTDLATRATDFVRVDKGQHTVEDVIAGVRHIIAERFGEFLPLRLRLRKLFWESGKLTTELTAAKAAEPGSPDGAVIQQASMKADVQQKTGDEAGLEQTGENETNDAADTNGSQADSIEVNQETSSGSGSPDNVADSGTAKSSNAELTTCPGAGDQAGSAVANAPKTAAEQIDDPESDSRNSSPQGSDSTGDDNSALEPVASEDDAAATKPRKKKRKKKKKKKARPEPFAEFAGFSEAIQKLPPHRTLAINRGEKSGKLKVRLHVDSQQLNEMARAELVPADHPFGEFLASVCDDAMQRLILPGVEREIRRDLTERAETHAVSVFARNLRHLFLQPPVRGQRILGIDPGYRTGCKVAVIDETGQPVGHGVFSIVGNAERIKNNQLRLRNLIADHQPQLIAIGNGSGCRAVEQFVSEVLATPDGGMDHLRYSIVNQAGTSTYSTSELGQQELPDHDPVIRSAISIARRLQDPLSELVKVNPANVGVGLYQHDIKARHLAESLESVVESCVNYVGVNANTASPSLLKYISGLGQNTARNLVQHRCENGPFQDRDSLKQVPGLGEVTFVQAAGFLRVSNGENPLDQTSIHPEDYPLAEKVLAKLACTIDELTPVAKPVPEPKLIPKPEVTDPAAEPTDVPATETAGPPDGETVAEVVVETEQPTMQVETSDPVAISTTADETTSDETVADGETNSESAPVPVPPKPRGLSPAELAEKRNRRKELVQKIRNLDTRQLAQEFQVGELKIRDLLRSLRNPSYDPREDLPAPVFRKGILKFEDLKQGMQLRGQIVNVVDFGVFLNIGIGESCLVHISRLANRYVRDPHWFYSVGDVLNVWVQDVDSEKRRVTLTAIRPDSQKRDRRRKPKSTSGSTPTSTRFGSGETAGRTGARGKGKGKPRHSASRGKPHHKRPPKKPKPVTPITDEMAEGKAPMRSFSDLLQFHQRKTDGESDKKSGGNDK